MLSRGIHSSDAVSRHRGHRPGLALGPGLRIPPCPLSAFWHRRCTLVFLQAIKLVKKNPTLPSTKLLYHEITNLLSPSSFIPLPGPKHSEVDRRGCVTLRPTSSGQGQRKALAAWQKAWTGLPACFATKHPTPF